MFAETSHKCSSPCKSNPNTEMLMPTGQWLTGNFLSLIKFYKSINKHALLRKYLKNGSIPNSLGKGKSQSTLTMPSTGCLLPNHTICVGFHLIYWDHCLVFLYFSLCSHLLHFYNVQNVWDHSPGTPRNFLVKWIELAPQECLKWSSRSIFNISDSRGSSSLALSL